MPEPGLVFEHIVWANRPCSTPAEADAVNAWLTEHGLQPELIRQQPGCLVVTDTDGTRPRLHAHQVITDPESKTPRIDWITNDVAIQPVTVDLKTTPPLPSLTEPNPTATRDAQSQRRWGVPPSAGQMRTAGERAL